MAVNIGAGGDHLPPAHFVQGDLFHGMEVAGSARVLPRPYQSEAVDRTFDRLHRFRSTLIGMPTGTGKTNVFAFLARLVRVMTEDDRFAVIRRPWMERKVLVLAHRDELIQQAYDAVRRVCPRDRLEVEKGGLRASRRSWQSGGARIVIGSVASMSRASRLKNFSADEFGMVIVDECHHCVPKNGMYWSILVHFGIRNQSSDTRFVGVTATADRSDEEDLGGAFESVAYHYQIHQAIEDGYLVPVVQQLIKIDGLDYDKIRLAGDGDLSPRELEDVLTEERKLHAVVGSAMGLANHGGQRRPTLVFCATRNQARLTAEIFNRHMAGCARSVDGSDDLKAVRRPAVRDFRQGRFQYLVSCDVLTEGFDCDCVRCVVVARPTNSRGRYAQMVGRGIRLLGAIVPAINASGSADERRDIIRNSGKPSCLVIDLIGTNTRHKLITTAALIGGGVCSPEVIALAESSARERMQSDTLLELRRAQEEADRIRRERRRRVIVGVRYRVEEIDPFDLLDVRESPSPGWYRRRRATDRQCRILEKNGLKTAGLDFWKATQLIDEIMRRRDRKLCTPKMVRLLARFGYDGSMMGFDDANRLITRIRENGWRRPEGDPYEW